MALITGITLDAWANRYAIPGTIADTDFFRNLIQAIKNDNADTASAITQQLSLPANIAGLITNLPSSAPEAPASPVYLNPYFLSLYLMEWMRHAGNIPTSDLADLASDFSNANALLSTFYASNGILRERMGILWGRVPMDFDLGSATDTGRIRNLFVNKLDATTIGSEGDRVDNIYAEKIGSADSRGLVDRLYVNHIGGELAPDGSTILDRYPVDDLFVNQIGSNSVEGIVQDIYTNNIRIVGRITMPDHSVDTDQLANDAVTTAKIASRAVTNSKIGDASVNANKLASRAVTESKIANDAVTEDKIKDDAVTEDKIKDDAVTTDKIASAGISRTKIVNGYKSPMVVASTQPSNNRTNIGVAGATLRGIEISFENGGSQTTAKMIAEVYIYFKHTTNAPGAIESRFRATLMNVEDGPPWIVGFSAESRLSTSNTSQSLTASVIQSSVNPAIGDNRNQYRINLGLSSGYRMQSSNDHESQVYVNLLHADRLFFDKVRITYLQFSSLSGWTRITYQEFLGAPSSTRSFVHNVATNY